MDNLIPSAPSAQPVDDEHYRRFLVANYPVIESVVRSVARRRRAGTSETEELASRVALKLVDNRYALLRKFEGRSSLSTFLTTVVDRVCRDGWAAERGRWRASAVATRLGPTAIRLERLLVRDGLPFEQACAILKMNIGVPESLEELERMRASLPYRERRRFVSLEDVAHFPARRAEVDTAAEAAEEESRRRTLIEALRRLPDSDRELLNLRFGRGWTIARIARTLQVDQKATYRQFERIYRQLRASLETARSS